MGIQNYDIKNFASSVQVKWCAGCGDFSVLKQVQKVLAEKSVSPSDHAFISGIGCSSRFPYYMGTYGFHTIHGRALAVATGVKVAKPDLHVTVITGDGDCLSIGGNHFLHAIRKNLDIVCLLLDNRIYGLTKGQISPTSEFGKVTKTTPDGSVDYPIDPVGLALSLGCSFVARSATGNIKHLKSVLKRAYEHKGFSLVHVLQNCVIFNDGAFDKHVGKGKDENTLFLEHGEPMLFGENKDRCIITEGLNCKTAQVSEVKSDQIITHDETSAPFGLINILEHMSELGMPMPMGVLYANEARDCFEENMAKQIDEVTLRKGQGDLQSLLSGNETWQVAKK